MKHSKNNCHRLKGFSCALALLTATLLQSTPVEAAHPLVTDDTGTQGIGRYQFELTAEHGYRDEDFAAERNRQYALTLAYGLRDDLDILVAAPYQRKITITDDVMETCTGRNDAGLDLKWRFFENGTLSMVLKPGVTFSTGDENKGFGSGRSGYSLYHITSFEPAPWAFHLQFGARHNRNTIGERENLGHLSFGGWREFGDKLKIVGDIGASTNPDKSSNKEKMFLIAGAIYSVTTDFDLDVGIRRGLRNIETDYTLLAGMALRF